MDTDSSVVILRGRGVGEVGESRVISGGGGRLDVGGEHSAIHG